ncbi:MAG: hypothetical protein LBE08_10375, partial [Bifidobacteriaceae bacterium]|nr:hypothetical protein [Bifidobacteriaceae bacterium]
MPKKKNKNKNRSGNPARQLAPRPARPDGVPAPRFPEDRKPPAGARVARLDGRDWALRPGMDDDWELADMLAE